MDLIEHILITFFSRSANTLKIAELIKVEVGGTMHEILPQETYPLDINAVIEQAKQEIRTGFKPPLKSKYEDITSDNLIFVGSPIWWGTMAPPVATFLSDIDFSGKTIIPFCTHGGGGSGQFEEDIARLCPRSHILNCLSIYRRDVQKAQSEVIAWLRRVELIQ